MSAHTERVDLVGPCDGVRQKRCLGRPGPSQKSQPIRPVHAPRPTREPAFAPCGGSDSDQRHSWVHPDEIVGVRGDNTVWSARGRGARHGRPRHPRGCGRRTAHRSRASHPCWRTRRLLQSIQDVADEVPRASCSWGCTLRSRSCVRRDHPHPREIGFISAPVSSQQSKLDDRRMGADVEVRECGFPGSTAAAIPCEGLSGEKGGLPR